MEQVEEVYEAGLKRFPTSTMYLLRAQVGVFVACFSADLLVVYFIKPGLPMVFLQFCFIYHKVHEKAVSALQGAEQLLPNFGLFFKFAARAVNFFLS